jgi:hypothetical protein
MENIDLNNDMWICTTRLGDQEIMNLVVTHLQSVGVRVYNALIDTSDNGPVASNYCYLGIDEHGVESQVGAYERIEYEMFDKFKKLTLKELLQIVENLKKEDGTV